MAFWIILVDLLCAASAYVAFSEKEALYRGNGKETKKQLLMGCFILRKLHRQRLHKPMGKPRVLCRLLKQRGLRTPHRNVQLVRGIEAWSLWAQLEREEGLLPLPEPAGQLERGLRRLLWRSPLRVALRHLGQHEGGVYRPLPV